MRQNGAAAYAPPQKIKRTPGQKPSPRSWPERRKPEIACRGIASTGMPIVTIIKIKPRAAGVAD